MDVKPEIQNEIISAISRLGSATITQLEKEVSLERHTLSKYLAILDQYGVLYYVPIGKAKVWHLNKAPLATVLDDKKNNPHFAEKVLRNIVGAIPDGLALVDEKCIIQYMNPILKEKYGNQVGRKFCKEITGVDCDGHLLNQFTKSNSATEKFEIKDGKDRNLFVRLSKLKNPDLSTSTLIIINDLTEKRKAKQKIMESDRRYKAIVDHVPAVVCRFKPDTTLTFVNQSYCDFFGMSQDQLLGKKWIETVPEKERTHFLKCLRALDKKSPVAYYTHKIINKSGEKWYEWQDQALFDEADNIIEYQSIGFDVTDRIEIEQGKNYAEKVTKTIFDGIPIGAAALGYEKEIIYVNDKLCDLVGYSPEELKTMKSFDIIHPDDIKKHNDERAKIMVGKIPFFKVEERLIHKNGSHVKVNLIAMSIVNGGKICCLLKFQKLKAE